MPLRYMDLSIVVGTLKTNGYATSWARTPEMIAIVLVFCFPQLASAGAMPAAIGLYPADERTEAAISAEARSDDGNLSVTMRVGNAADSRVGL